MSVNKEIISPHNYWGSRKTNKQKKNAQQCIQSQCHVSVELTLKCIPLKILNPSDMAILTCIIKFVKIRIYNVSYICRFGYTNNHHFFGMVLCILWIPCSEKNWYYENVTSWGMMFHLHLNRREHGCPTSCAGEEGSVLPQKLFAAVNTGSFHESVRN